MTPPFIQGQRTSAPEPATTIHRTYEIAALRPDGTRWIWQARAPALPLFDSAFSAFGRGMLVPTAEGLTAIEDLVPGDMVKTVSGDPSPVVWIGSTTFVPADMGTRPSLIRVTADSFGMNRPEAYLTLGPNARVLQTPPHLKALSAGQELLTPINQFIDSVNVIHVRPPTPVRLFHICLARHAAVDIGGLGVETFHPGMHAFRNVSHTQRDQFLSMFPHITHHTDFGPLAHPRAPEEDNARTAA
ncbi:MAG: Hint domain-containing protein [Rhodobacteraceae bacterium]|nr:Hint domain-containing protein [Paracoccaceae bacterium]